MSWTKYDWSLSRGAKLLNSLECVLVDYNLLVNGSENEFHYLSHPPKSSVIVVRNYSFDVFYCCFFYFAVNFVLRNVLVQSSLIVG